MAGKEGSNSKRGKAGSASRRRQGRRPAGEAGTFSLGQCTSKHHTAVANGEEGFFSLRPCATKHMAVEEALTTGEDGTFSLKPCVTKHMAVEEVTDEEGPPIGCPSKRKAAGSGCWAAAAGFPKAGEWEALEMLEERVVAVESHNLLNRHDPMVVDVFVDAEEVRERVKADLRAFPESAALDTVELDEAVDRIVMESKPETASLTAAGMRRLSDEDIAAFFSHMTEIPTVDDLAPGGLFPPGRIDDRRQQLDKEVQPEKRMFEHELGVLLAKIRVDLLTKGYVEVPKLYLEDTPDLIAAHKEAVALNPPEHKDYTGVFAGPDDEEWWIDDAALEKLALESF